MGKVTENWTWHPVHISHGLRAFSGWWNSFSRFMGLKVELVCHDVWCTDTDMSSLFPELF